MSYTVTLYSPSEELPDLRRVVGNLSLNGWTARFLDEPLGLVRDSGRLLNATVYAWPSTSARSAEAARAIEDRDELSIDVLYRAEVITSCSLIIHRPYALSDEAEPDELAELREEVGARHFRAMQRARTLYSADSSAARNSMAVQFQLVLVALLAALCGGLVEDPQTGAFSHRQIRAPRGA